MLSPQRDRDRRTSLHRRKISEISFTDSVAESYNSNRNSIFSTTSNLTSYSVPSGETASVNIEVWEDELKKIIIDKQMVVLKEPLKFVHDLSNLNLHYYHEFWDFSATELSSFKTLQPEEYMRQSRMMEMFYYVKNIRFRMLMLTEFIDPNILSKLSNLNSIDKMKIQISWMALSTIFDNFTLNLKRLIDGQVLINANAFISVMIHSFYKLNKKYKDFCESCSILRDFVEKGGIKQIDLFNYNKQLKDKYNLSFNDSIDLTLLLKGYILTMLSKFHDPILKLQKSLQTPEINELVSLYKNIQLTIDFFSPQQSASIVSKIKSINQMDSISLYSINSVNHDRQIVFIKQASWSKLWGGNYCVGKIVLLDNYMLLIESNENGEEILSFPPMLLVDLDFDQDMHDAMFLQFKETLAMYKSSAGSEFKSKIKNSNDNTFALTHKVTGLQIVGVFEELKLQFGRTGFQTMKLQQKISNVNFKKFLKIEEIGLIKSDEHEIDYHFGVDLINNKSILVDKKKVYLKNDNGNLIVLFETQYEFGKCDVINSNFIFLHNSDLYTLKIEDLLLKSTRWKLLDRGINNFEVQNHTEKTENGKGRDVIKLYKLKGETLELNTIDRKLTTIYSNGVISENVKSIFLFDKWGIVYTKIDDPLPQQLYLSSGKPLLNFSTNVKNLLKDQEPKNLFFRADQNQVLVGYQDYLITAYMRLEYNCEIFEERILKFNFKANNLSFDKLRDLVYVYNDDSIDVWELDFNRDAKDVPYSELIVTFRGQKIKLLNEKLMLMSYKNEERGALQSLGYFNVN